MGLVLPRNDLANWVIRCSQEWLEPVYWRIHKYLMGCGVLHMDETRIQCNKEAGKKASSESFIWVIRSGACEELQAAFFYYSQTRNGDTAKELLETFYGYLVTDAYSGYEKAEHIIRSLCWAHYPRSIIIREEANEILFYIGFSKHYLNNNTQTILKNLEPFRKCLKRWRLVNQARICYTDTIID